MNTYTISEKDYILLQKVQAARQRKYERCRLRRRNDAEYRAARLAIERKSRLKKRQQPAK